MNVPVIGGVYRLLPLKTYVKVLSVNEDDVRCLLLDSGGETIYGLDDNNEITYTRVSFEVCFVQADREWELLLARRDIIEANKLAVQKLIELKCKLERGDYIFTNMELSENSFSVIYREVKYLK